MKVTLTPTEYAVAWTVAQARMVADMEHPGDRYTAARQPLGRLADYQAGIHVRGAFGELAVAKALGIYWPAAVNPTRHDPDLGDDIQVRCTGYRTGRLCHHPDDPAHHRYVLVVGDPLDRLDVVGWRWGADCRDDEYWTDPGGGAAWFVPQSDLTPIPERPGRHRA